MSDFRDSAFRERRIRWEDEEMDKENRDPWDRDQLNDELLAHELEYWRRHQVHLPGSYPAAAPPSSPALLALIPSVAPSQPFESFESAEPAEPPPGYMEQPSAFVLDTPPTESTFLESYPKGNATLTYQNDDGELESIRNVNFQLIEESCPILGMAFEPRRSGPQLFLETLTSTTAYPFLRYLYTGSYSLRPITGEPGDRYEDVPTSVLLHCQLYRLADIYDLPDLKSQAYVNVLRQCEFGCSSPEKPIDLCAAIRFVYEYLHEHENLVDAILNYCVSCFLQHRLADDAEFKQLAYDLRPFHQALCKNSMEREFENETASAIVQMPFKPYIPETYASREDAAATKFDDVFHFHSTDRFDKATKKRRISDVKAEKTEEELFTLPARPRLDTPDRPDWPLPDEDYKFGSKRRASSITNESTPAVGGISQLRVANDEAVLSEPEYEIVERPEVAVRAYDSDSDSSDFVEIKREEKASDWALPTRSKVPATLPDNKKTVENDSDSEWTLL